MSTIESKINEKAVTDSDIKNLGIPREATLDFREVSKTKSYNATKELWTITKTTEIDIDVFDVWVEVPIAKLEENEVGVDTEKDKQAKARKWKDARVCYPSLDGTKAIICLSPKVSESAYHAKGLSKEMMKAYIAEFGGENLMDFSEFSALKSSSEYAQAVEA